MCYVKLARNNSTKTSFLYMFFYTENDIAKRVVAAATTVCDHRSKEITPDRKLIEQMRKKNTQDCCSVHSLDSMAELCMLFII